MASNHPNYSTYQNYMSINDDSSPPHDAKPQHQPSLHRQDRIDQHSIGSSLTPDFTAAHSKYPLLHAKHMQQHHHPSYKCPHVVINFQRYCTNKIFPHLQDSLFLYLSYLPLLIIQSYVLHICGIPAAYALILSALTTSILSLLSVHTSYHPVLITCNIPLLLYSILVLRNTLNYRLTDILLFFTIASVITSIIFSTRTTSYLITFSTFIPRAVRNAVNIGATTFVIYQSLRLLLSYARISHNPEDFEHFDRSNPLTSKVTFFSPNWDLDHIFDSSNGSSLVQFTSIILYTFALIAFLVVFVSIIMINEHNPLHQRSKRVDRQDAQCDEETRALLSEPNGPAGDKVGYGSGDQSSKPLLKPSTSRTKRDRQANQHFGNTYSDNKHTKANIELQALHREDEKHDLFDSDEKHDPPSSFPTSTLTPTHGPSSMVSTHQLNTYQTSGVLPIDDHTQNSSPRTAHAPIHTPTIHTSKSMLFRFRLFQAFPILLAACLFIYILLFSTFLNTKHSALQNIMFNEPFPQQDEKSRTVYNYFSSISQRYIDPFKASLPLSTALFSSPQQLHRIPDNASKKETRRLEKSNDNIKARNRDIREKWASFRQFLKNAALDGVIIAFIVLYQIIDTLNNFELIIFHKHLLVTHQAKVKQRMGANITGHTHCLRPDHESPNHTHSIDDINVYWYNLDTNDPSNLHCAINYDDRNDEERTSSNTWTVPESPSDQQNRSRPAQRSHQSQQTTAAAATATKSSTGATKAPIDPFTFDHVHQTDSSLISTRDDPKPRNEISPPHRFASKKSTAQNFDDLLHLKELMRDLEAPTTTPKQIAEQPQERGSSDKHNPARQDTPREHQPFAHPHHHRSLAIDYGHTAGPPTDLPRADRCTPAVTSNYWSNWDFTGQTPETRARSLNNAQYSHFSEESPNPTDICPVDIDTPRTTHTPSASGALRSDSKDFTQKPSYRGSNFQHGRFPVEQESKATTFDQICHDEIKKLNQSIKQTEKQLQALRESSSKRNKSTAGDQADPKWTATSQQQQQEQDLHSPHLHPTHHYHPNDPCSSHDLRKLQPHADWNVAERSLEPLISPHYITTPRSHTQEDIQHADPNHDTQKLNDQRLVSGVGQFLPHHAHTQRHNTLYRPRQSMINYGLQSNHSSTDLQRQTELGDFNQPDDSLTFGTCDSIRNPTTIHDPAMISNGLLPPGETSFNETRSSPFFNTFNTSVDLYDNTPSYSPGKQFIIRLAPDMSTFPQTVRTPITPTSVSPSDVVDQPDHTITVEQREPVFVDGIEVIPARQCVVSQPPRSSSATSVSNSSENSISSRPSRVSVQSSQLTSAPHPSVEPVNEVCTSSIRHTASCNVLLPVSPKTPASADANLADIYDLKFDPSLQIIDELPSSHSTTDSPASDDPEESSIKHLTLNTNIDNTRKDISGPNQTGSKSKPTVSVATNEAVLSTRKGLNKRDDDEDEKFDKNIAFRNQPQQQQQEQQSGQSQSPQRGRLPHYSKPSDRTTFLTTKTSLLDYYGQQPADTRFLTTKRSVKEYYNDDVIDQRFQTDKRDLHDFYHDDDHNNRTQNPNQAVLTTNPTDDQAQELGKYPHNGTATTVQIAGAPVLKHIHSVDSCRQLLIPPKLVNTDNIRSPVCCEDLPKQYSAQNNLLIPPNHTSSVLSTAILPRVESIHSTPQAPRSEHFHPFRDSTPVSQTHFFGDPSKPEGTVGHLNPFAPVHQVRPANNSTATNSTLHSGIPQSEEYQPIFVQNRTKQAGCDINYGSWRTTPQVQAIFDHNFTNAGDLSAKSDQSLPTPLVFHGIDDNDHQFSQNHQLERDKQIYEQDAQQSFRSHESRSKKSEDQSQQLSDRSSHLPIQRNDGTSGSEALHSPENAVMLLQPPALNAQPLQHSTSHQTIQNIGKANQAQRSDDQHQLQPAQHTTPDDDERSHPSISHKLVNLAELGADQHSRDIDFDKFHKLHHRIRFHQGSTPTQFEEFGSHNSDKYQEKMAYEEYQYQQQLLKQQPNNNQQSHIKASQGPQNQRERELPSNRQPHQPQFYHQDETYSITPSDKRAATIVYFLSSFLSAIGMFGFSLTPLSPSNIPALKSVAQKQALVKEKQKKRSGLLKKRKSSSKRRKSRSDDVSIDIQPESHVFDKEEDVTHFDDGVGAESMHNNNNNNNNNALASQSPDKASLLRIESNSLEHLFSSASYIQELKYTTRITCILFTITALFFAPLVNYMFFFPLTIAVLMACYGMNQLWIRIQQYQHFELHSHWNQYHYQHHHPNLNVQHAELPPLSQQHHGYAHHHPLHLDPHRPVDDFEQNRDDFDPLLMQPIRKNEGLGSHVHNTNTNPFQQFDSEEESCYEDLHRYQHYEAEMSGSDDQAGRSFQNWEQRDQLESGQTPPPLPLQHHNIFGAAYNYRYGANSSLRSDFPPSPPQSSTVLLLHSLLFASLIIMMTVGLFFQAFCVIGAYCLIKSFVNLITWFAQSQKTQSTPRHASR